MGQERKTNWVEMMGEAVREPAFSHSYGGEDYFLFPFRCLRLSGVEDVVNVIVSRNTMDDFDIRAGQRIALKGEVRSYNNRSGTGSKLVITVHAAQILPGQSGEDYNRVALTGNLCRKPVYRRTPMGREITDLLLAVNRSYGKADYLPCIVWGGLARQAARWEAGDRVRLRGRLQSRNYIKVQNQEAVEKVAFEVSVMAVERVKREEFEQRGMG